MKVKLYDTKKNYMTLKKIIGHEKLYELISQQFLLTATLITL